MLSTNVKHSVIGVFILFVLFSCGSTQEPIKSVEDEYPIDNTSRYSSKKKQKPTQDTAFKQSTLSDTSTPSTSSNQPPSTIPNPIANQIEAHTISVESLPQIPKLPEYVRQKNTYWQHCKYKDVIVELLYAELQETLSKNNKPLSYYNQWFLDLHDPEYTTDEILKFYENKVVDELINMYKTTTIDYTKAWEKQPCIKSIR